MATPKKGPSDVVPETPVVFKSIPHNQADAASADADITSSSYSPTRLVPDRIEVDSPANSFSLFPVSTQDKKIGTSGGNSLWEDGAEPQQDLHASTQRRHAMSILARGVLRAARSGLSGPDQ
jgi:hypothetical protein